jgi:hypothetical protein
MKFKIGSLVRLDDSILELLGHGEDFSIGIIVDFCEHNRYTGEFWSAENPLEGTPLVQWQSGPSAGKSFMFHRGQLELIDGN